MNEIHCTAFPSALGWMAAAWSGVRLHELTLGRHSPRAALKSLRHVDPEPGEADAFMDELIGRLQAFTSGDGNDDFLDIQLETASFTEFQRTVVHHCRRIPFGRTVTYGQLASAAGYPGAARAVGNVMSANQFPLIVPCHRVVAAGGGLGGFSAPDGLRLKRELLTREGARFERPTS